MAPTPAAASAPRRIREFGVPVRRTGDDCRFGPLGITSERWNTDDNGRADTGGHLHMRPRDRARIGQLALRRGAWNGAQLVSSAWIDASTSQHGRFDAGANGGYGYLGWHGVEPWKLAHVDMFFANGAGGQYIFVVPQLDLVVVFTGENTNIAAAPQAAYRILDAYIVGAVNAGA